MEGRRGRAIIYMLLGLGWIVFWLTRVSGPVTIYFATVGGQEVRGAAAAGALSISVGRLSF